MQETIDVNCFFCRRSFSKMLEDEDLLCCSSTCYTKAQDKFEAECFSSYEKDMSERKKGRKADFEKMKSELDEKKSLLSFFSNQPYQPYLKEGDICGEYPSVEDIERLKTKLKEAQTLLNLHLEQHSPVETSLSTDTGIGRKISQGDKKKAKKAMKQAGGGGGSGGGAR